MNYLFLFLVNFIISANALTYQDLQKNNGSFYQLASCHVPDPTCYCDDACNEYNDCCLDAKAYNPLRVDRVNIYVCKPASQHSTHTQNFVYFKEKCMQGWSGGSELRKCDQPNERESDLITIGVDPKLDTPVTSIFSNITYKNEYCAVCNNESYEHIQRWAVELQCNFNDTHGLGEGYVRSNMKFVNPMWVVNSVNGSESWRSCRMLAVIPENLNSRVRRCIDNVARCKPHLVKDKNDDKLCQSYTAYVSSHLNTYKNYHCALCNERYIADFLKYRTIGTSSVNDEGSELQENDCPFEYKSCLYSGNCFKGAQCHEEDRCKCDNQCMEYKDCCVEAEDYDLSKWLSTVNRFDCVTVHSDELDDIYLRQDCSDDWPNDAVKEHCQELFLNIPDVPVTSTTTNVTYKNRDCGLCNKESPEDLRSWSLQVSCKLTTADNASVIEIPSESKVKENLQLVEGEYGIFIKKNEKSEFLPCGFKSVPGNDLLPRIRPCTKFISTCARNWTDSEAERLCASYASIVSTSFDNYRNYHCAICNFVKSHEILCGPKRPAVGSRLGVSQSFSVLMDVSDVAKVKNRQNSGIALKF